MQRRDFFKTGALVGAGLVLGSHLDALESSQDGGGGGGSASGPLVISTWRHGIAANEAAFRILQVSGSAVDAAQHGVMMSEKDPKVSSVGYGGWPNADGVVQLDAAIMDGRSMEAGSVAGLENILHPVAVARKVMDETRHVMLVGEGAKQFALKCGFKEQDLLTETARKAWEKQKAGKPRKMKAEDDHDTIGMVAMDRSGSMAASCTTSGSAWKIPGRVGDSPLIGHGLYCDNRAGGAAATGLGEEVIKVCGSYQVVEFMRQGIDPDEAIRRVLQRAIDRNPKNRDVMMGYVAMRADGKLGYGCTTKGFQAAISRGPKPELVTVDRYVPGEKK